MGKKQLIKLLAFCMLIILVLTGVGSYLPKECKNEL